MTIVPSDAPAARCTNCGAAVQGRYCSDCGQSTEYHLHSFWDVVGEATEVVTHADSRLWRTLWPLVFRPGFLSQQFLAGRRASYLSPFRLYIVLSIVFFLIASVTGPLAHRADQVSAAAPRAPATADLCRMQVSTVPGPEWVRQQFASACISSQADQGRAITQSFIHNLGRAMFIFLPLLAAAMQLMYRRPKRSYVTHLVLLIHNHAFAFLLMSALLATLHWIHSGLMTALLSGVAICYLIYYLYRSIARVYAESWWRTLAKFVALSVAYAVCAACTVFLAGLYSAETV